jgi:2-iminobutanoate/2-iminopropanoate deaminase
VALVSNSEVRWSFSLDELVRAAESTVSGRREPRRSPRITHEGGTVNRTTIHTAAVPSTGKPYSQATSFGGLLFVSGQVAWDAEAGHALDGGFEVQTRRVLDNLRAIVEAGGSTLDHVLKTTCFLVDIADAPRFNEIYREYFPVDPPARSTVEVSGLSPGFLIEVEAIAALPAAGRGVTDPP